MIFDSKGDLLATRDQNGQIQFQIADDIDLNTELIDEKINNVMEESQSGEDTSTGGTAKAGDGRDLGNKEHESKDQKENVENIKKAKGKVPPKDQTKLENLKELDQSIIDGKPRIQLGQIINGYPLWEILGIEEKLKDRLPAGVNPKVFRNGFLSFVDSKKLEAIDGKKRMQKDTFVVSSFDQKVIIELDEQVLQPVDLGRSQDQQDIEKTAQRYENGEETEKPTVNTESTRSSVYEIPNVKDRFSSDEGYRLAVDWDRDRMLNNKRQAGGHDKEVTFIQYSLDNSYTERERGEKSLEYRLKSIDEPKVTGDSEREAEEEADLARKGTDESKFTRREHMGELADEVVDECFKEIKDIGEFYNRERVKEMIKKEVLKLHKEGKSDEKIKEQMIEYMKGIVGEERENVENSRGPQGDRKRM